MTNSKYTFTDLSGSFDITVELDEDHPEPVPATCERAPEDLTVKGIVPAGALMTDMAVSSPVAGMVRCSVSWVASQRLTSLTGG